MYTNKSILGARNTSVSGVYNFETRSHADSIYCEYVSISGGGGGWNGGGGAGGMDEGIGLELIPGVSYTVTIGAGGTGASSYGYNASTKAGFGSKTCFGITGQNPIIQTIGGGRGGFGSSAGRGFDGACGGGYGYSSDTYAITSSGLIGYAGALCYGAGIATPYGSGGGGGMGGAGQVTLNGGAGTKIGGDGGVGKATSISGSSVTYCGGGGGSSLLSGASSAGVGGTGGGGNGGNAAAGSNGSANTGGGGGGAGASGAGGNGGSGKFCLRYPGPKRFNSGYVSTASGWSYHEWTSTTTFTVS